MVADSEGRGKREEERRGPRPWGGEKRQGWLWNHLGFPPLRWSAWSLVFVSIKLV